LPTRGCTAKGILPSAALPYQGVQIMATLNQCSFIGHLGKDPELNVTSDGKPYTKFSIAVDQGKDKKPMWLNITTWDKLAERMEQYLYKGAQVFVQGQLQISIFTDKKGTERQAVDIRASNVQLLDKKAENADEQEAPV
jgi:single-strand DNA-binding protein